MSNLCTCKVNYIHKLLHVQLISYLAFIITSLTPCEGVYNIINNLVNEYVKPGRDVNN